MKKLHLFYALFLIGILLLGCETKTTKINESKAVKIEDSTVLLAPDTLKGTKIESFVSQVGSVIIRNYSKIGSIPGLYGASLSIESIELINASDDTRLYGIVIRNREGGGDYYHTTNSSYIDYDEIEPLIEGLDYISKIDKSITTLDFFEATYYTRGEFKIAKYYDQDSTIRLALKCGSMQRTHAFFDISELPKIKDLIVKAKQTLDIIRKKEMLN